MHLRLYPVGLKLPLLPLLTERFPLLFLRGEQLHLLSDLVLHLPLLKFFGGDSEPQLLTIFLLAGDLALIDGDNGVQLGNASIEFVVFILDPR